MQTRVSTLVTDPWTEHREHRRRQEPALKAAATDQLRLLDVQALDARIDQLAHRRATLPEHAALQELEKALSELADNLVAAETEQSDIARELKKAEGDVEQVQARAARDQQRLDAGQVGSPKELEGLQHEIATLSRRQSDLEDVELEIMERLEAVQSRHAELSAQRAEAEAKAAELTASRDTTTAEIDTRGRRTAGPARHPGRPGSTPSCWRSTRRSAPSRPASARPS